LTKTPLVYTVVFHISVWEALDGALFGRAKTNKATLWLQAC